MAGRVLARMFDAGRYGGARSAWFGTESAGSRAATGPASAATPPQTGGGGGASAMEDAKPKAAAPVVSAEARHQFKLLQREKRREHITDARAAAAAVAATAAARESAAAAHRVQRDAARALSRIEGAKRSAAHQAAVAREKAIQARERRAALASREAKQALRRAAGHSLLVAESSSWVRREEVDAAVAAALASPVDVYTGRPMAELGVNTAEEGASRLTDLASLLARALETRRLGRDGEYETWVAEAASRHLTVESHLRSQLAEAMGPLASIIEMDDDERDGFKQAGSSVDKPERTRSATGGVAARRGKLRPQKLA